MPYHSLGDKFIGRIADFKNIHNSLNASSNARSVYIIAGTGGLGKTQLATEYAHRYGREYGGVYWVDADRGLTALISQISEAAQIEVNTKADELTQLEQLWQNLNRQLRPSLVILDNFPEKNAALNRFLPSTGRIHTIVTTRRQDLSSRPGTALKTLSTEESIRLLNSGGRQFGADAAALVERLGCLPLALELVKSFLNYRTDVTPQQLLDEMGTAGEMAVLTEFASQYGDELPNRHELDIVKTFQLSWDLAPELGQQILRAMAELAPVPVPRPLLLDILNLPPQGGLRDPFGQSISELSRLSLIELDTKQNPAAHRLILAFVSHRNTTDNASPFDRCREVIQAQMEQAVETTDAATFRALEAIVPHAEALLKSGRLSPEDSVSLSTGIGLQHRAAGRYTAAHILLRSALQSAERNFAPGHPSIATRQSNLALVLRALGQPEEARDLLRQALASAEKNFEPGHPSRVTIQSNLAIVQQELGD